MSGATPRLVFCEGFPGTGKSTTAQWIVRSLERAGRRARWAYEEETPHPVSGGYDWTRLDTMEKFSAAYLGRWRALMAALAETDVTVVLDSAFLQWPIFTFLRHDAGEEVLDVIARVADVVRPCAALVYAPADDPKAAWDRIVARRGMSWHLGHVTRFGATPFARSRGLDGPAALYEYWREHATRCDRAVERVALPTLTLPAAMDWKDRRTAIAAFLGFEPVPPDPSAPALERYVGEYRARSSSRVVRITIDDGRLLADGLLWPRNALLPAGGRSFDAESWPHRLTFVEDERGAVTGFTVDGPAMWSGRPDASFDRVV